MKVRSEYVRPANYQWEKPELNQIDPAFLEAVQAQGLPELFTNVLWNRGIQDAEKLQHFLSPDLTDTYDPFLMFEMDKAVERIQQAVEAGEKILIYGDYDADGITSTTVMKEALELIGADVCFYLPNRFTDGYGPNARVFQEQIEAGIQLIITVDNGVAGHEAIDFAQNAGVDVIVTDHHELPETLPSAYAIIHPRHPQGNYPFGELAGVGVAFKVAQALLDEIPTEFLDIVAIGTVADLVSLTDENRVLVKYGIEALKQTERMGLHALCLAAGVRLPDLSAETIGFTLAPRLNAIGRLGSAMPGVELLSTFDEEEAQRLANLVQQKNTERQEIVKQITKEALAEIRQFPRKNIYVLANQDWNEGVLGIVASRLVQEVHRPVILLSINQETGIAKGSGRSIEAVNLYDVLQKNQTLLVKFGGHHAAAGMSVAVETIDELAECLNQTLAEENIDFSAGDQLVIDARLSLDEVNLSLIEKMQMLAPFGTDNSVPLFLFEDGVPKQIKQLGAEQEHLKFEFTADGASLDVIGFGFGKDELELNQPDPLMDIVGELSINEWNGHRKPQLMLKDFEIKGLQVFDYRGNKLNKEIFAKEEMTFVFFHQSYLEKTASIPKEQCLLIDDDVEIAPFYQQVMLMDCPDTMEQLHVFIQKLSTDRIYLCCFSKEECYMTGMPSREQFARLFQFIKQVDQADIRYKLKELAGYLKIKENLLIFMIQVFFDLNFVTIEDGMMSQVKDPVHRPLTESQIYQKRLEKMKVEELLLYSDLTTLKKWFETQEEVK